MHKPLYLAASAAIALSLATPVLSRPMTETDLATMKRLSAPAVSPDGSMVAYQLRETDLEGNKGRTDLYLLKLGDSTATPVKVASKPDKNEHDPVFSPDGKSVYYISNESGSDQIWRYDVKAGQATQVSNLKTDVAGFKIAPDGKKFALWGDIAKDCPTFGCAKDGDTSKPGPGTGREYDQLMVRHWDAWETPGNYSRIFSFPLGADGKLSGDGVAMGKGLTGDAPSKPFGGGEEVAWSADGKTLHYTLRLADAKEALSTDLNIYAVQADGKNAKNLTKDNRGTDTTPAASPDGKYLAWAAMARAGYEADRLILMLRDLKTGKVSPLTDKWDRSVASIAWTPDSKNILVTAGEILDTPLFRIDLKGKVTRLTEGGHVSTAVPLGNGSVLYAMDNVRGASDLYLRTPDGARRTLTAVNADMFAAIDNVDVQRFDFKGAGGDQVWGQITKPGLCGGLDRFPWVNGLRAGLHRRDQQGLGRQTA
jgi:dipeptidyl aminopeptidase/acylaminoacyl peptidase